MSNRRRLQAEEEAEAFIPLPLVEEILSNLTVKSLLRLSCTCKSWNNLISDPSFVQMHLKRSASNPYLILTWHLDSTRCCGLFPVRGLLENPSPSAPSNDNPWHIIGSCNGLLCLMQQYSKLCLWNPATKRSRIFPCELLLSPFFKFAFGYDKHAAVYKVVAYHVKQIIVGQYVSVTSYVKVFTFGDNDNRSWRSIQGFPNIPFYWLWMSDDRNNGVYFDGTVNWLAFPRKNDITGHYCLILSLDLTTETYSQLPLPRVFYELPSNWPIKNPSVGVFLDSLCFSRDYKGTHFVIWQMKDFRVQDSWVQLHRISYQNLCSWDSRIEHFWHLRLFPLYISMNGNTLILANDAEESREADQSFIFYYSDNKVEKIRIDDKISWDRTKVYVQSLISTG